jgi:hypothetical protein
LIEDLAVIDHRQFIGFRLHGGFIIKEIAFTNEPMVDALDREAIAQTRIVGREFRLLIGGGLGDDELSVTLYHEILEAAAVADLTPPASVVDFNEKDFERAAQEAHQKWGNASPASLNLMLQSFGFREE